MFTVKQANRTGLQVGISSVGTPADQMITCQVRDAAGNPMAGNFVFLLWMCSSNDPSQIGAPLDFSSDQLINVCQLQSCCPLTLLDIAPSEQGNFKPDFSYFGFEICTGNDGIAQMHMTTFNINTPVDFFLFATIDRMIINGFNGQIFSAGA